MALNLGIGGGGDFLPVCKYNAKGGRWFRVEGVGSAKEEIDITDNFAAILDFNNMEHGWVQFEPRVDIRMFPFGSSVGAAPGENYREGLRLKARLGQSCGGGLHEIIVVSGMLYAAVDPIHTEYEKRGDGMLPIVTHLRAEPVKGQHGTNYRPVLDIVDWKDPSIMDDDAGTQAAAPAQPVASPAQPAPPPVANPAPVQTAPVQASSLANEF